MKNILIVGAGKGIGLEIAKQHANTHHVYAFTRTLTSELSALPVKSFEVNSLQPAETFLPFLPDTLDALVYCPGSINLKPFNRLTLEDFKLDFEQNVLGFIQVLQAVLPKLKASGNASVVAFSTVAAKMGMSFHASISASKSALEGLIKSLAAEYAASKIRFNAIAPSLTQTPLAQYLINTPEKLEAASKRHPLQRVGQASDMANAAQFLISDQSSWITGQILAVDGGMSVIK